MRKASKWSLNVGLCVIVSAVAFSGCGDDEDRVPPMSSAGEAGSAGNSPVAGTSNDGGTSAGGEGGNGEPGGNGPVGGMPSAGMAGFSGEAGAAGSGVTGPKCGDGTKDAGEECDDGNIVNGDGCSSKCTNKCEACEATQCTFSTFPEAYNTIDELCFKAFPGDVATDGPAKGAPRSKLCTELVECVRASKCVSNLSAPQLGLTVVMQRCFCGSEDNCQTQPASGPCLKEFQRAAETEEDGSVIAKLFDVLGVDELGLAVGRATAVVQNCDLNACGKECYFGKASDACSRCTLGDSPQESFETGQAALCGIPAVACDASPKCAAVVACGRETKCAATSVADCYADGAGPCATQITTASGLTDVAAIKTAMNPTKDTDLGYAVSLLACMKSSCNAQCLQ